MPTLEGTVERIVFASVDDAYTVVRLQSEDVGRGGLAAVGHMPGVAEGQRLRLEGEWVDDKRYGRQFRVERFALAVPATVEGIERYLSSGFITGVGPVIARRIVDQFGERTLEVIREQPEQLELVDGIGARRAEDIQRAWKEQHGLQEAMVSLTSLGIPPSLAARVLRVYGDRAPSLVQSDPYRLADDVRGIGFKRADAIAAELGIARDSPRRAEAGLMHTLASCADEGHLYALRQPLLERARELLGVDVEVLEPALDALVARHRVVIEPGEDGDAVYLHANLQIERELAARLRRLSDVRVHLTEHELAQAVARAEQGLSVELSEAQREAVRAALASRLVVITGGPGTGKTTVTRAVCEALRFAGMSLSLCAPTGRAAKRMAEATGLRASTVHRLLGFDPRINDFQRGPDSPLETDAVLVDEASMLDAALARSLVGAVPADARMVWIGDVDQLPPVGAGAVLHHLIESGVPRTIRLDRIFRQEAESLIVSNAHRILAGEAPESGEPGGAADFYVVPAGDPEAALDKVSRIVADRIPSAYGFDPVDDIQVLTPMHRGELGAASLNAALQARLNPHGRALKRGHRELREGDKVMQIRNNYDKDVFNGDLGRVERVDAAATAVDVRFDERVLTYDAEELDELELAYAVTVHKSQGSEYPAVVIPLHTQHYVMLRRNLLYTAITRAKRLVVLVASSRAIEIAVGRHDEGSRASRLAARLRGEAPC